MFNPEDYMKETILLTVERYVGPPWKTLPRKSEHLFRKILRYGAVVGSGDEIGAGVVFGKWVIASLSAVGGQRITKVSFTDGSESVGYVTLIDREYRLARILLASPTNRLPKLENIYQYEGEKFFNVCCNRYGWNMISHTPMLADEFGNFPCSFKLCKDFYSSLGIFSYNGNLVGISIGAIQGGSDSSNLNFAVAPGTWVSRFLNVN